MARHGRLVGLVSPEHVNVGMIEIMPTLQVPGGLTFNQSR